MTVFFPLALRMAGRAYRHQIGERVIELVAVHVVNVKKFAYFRQLKVANLAGVIFPFAYDAHDSLPVLGILPFGNATLPRGVSFSTNSTAYGKRNALRTNGDAELLHKFSNCCSTDAKLIRDLFERFPGLVFTAQPFRVFVLRFFAVVTLNKNVPHIFSLVPNYLAVAATFTKRRLFTFGRHIYNGLAPLAARMTFFTVPNFDFAAAEDAVNGFRNDPKLCGDHYSAVPGSIRRGVCVKPDNFFFNCFSCSSRTHGYS